LFYILYCHKLLLKNELTINEDKKEMITASRTDEANGEFQITKNTIASTTLPNLPITTPIWLKRARIISALVYILLQLGFFIFIVICIALYPRCEPAGETPWWLNSVFLRFSNRNFRFDNLTDKIDQYKNDFSMQALWLSPLIPSSNQGNPLEWSNIDGRFGGKDALNSLITKAHDLNIRILMDYPLNHLSLQSDRFSPNDSSYFVWNAHGNTSNWKNNQQKSVWIYSDQDKTFYLNQFSSNNDSIDINYRNNRVFNDMIDSFSYWEKNFQIDGYNLQGISYAYEDYEQRNETNNNNQSLMRHLDEDYLLLARIRSEISKNKILLFDSIDSLSTSNDHLLERYYGDRNSYLGGVQLASLNDFQFIDESMANLTIVFENYQNSIFYRENRPLLWSSFSLDSNLNEAFFAACLFHLGAISIDIDRQANFSPEQRERLHQIIKFAQTLDVFRVGTVEQTILSQTDWITIERARRGSKHHMIIVNVGPNEQENTIELKSGLTDAVEILLSNIADPGSKYETNALIDMTSPIRLRSYEYLIIRWSPSIDGLSIIF